MFSLELIPCLSDFQNRFALIMLDQDLFSDGTKTSMNVREEEQ
jgi:hypothetical protein